MKIGHGKVQFSIPNELGQCTVVGAIRTAFASFELFPISHSRIAYHGDRRGPHIDLIATKRDKGWIVGRSPLFSVSQLAELTQGVAAFLIVGIGVSIEPLKR